MPLGFKMGKFIYPQDVKYEYLQYEYLDQLKEFVKGTNKKLRTKPFVMISDEKTSQIVEVGDFVLKSSIDNLIFVLSSDEMYKHFTKMKGGIKSWK